MKLQTGRGVAFFVMLTSSPRRPPGVERSWSYAPPILSIWVVVFVVAESNIALYATHIAAPSAAKTRTAIAAEMTPSPRSLRAAPMRSRVV